jgi:hypothetical protein
MVSEDKYQVSQLLCSWGRNFQLTEQDRWFRQDDHSTLIIRDHAVPSLDTVTTIEEAEDYYLSKALSLGVTTKHPFGHLTAFDLNAHVSESAYKNRRGPAWVAMMHPEMFDRIRYFKDMGKHWRGNVTQWEFEDPTPVIGRWTLQATEEFRRVHVWTSTHLDKNVMITAFRDTNPNGRDGVFVAKTPMGFGLTPIDDCLTSVGTYITKRTYPLSDD